MKKQPPSTRRKATASKPAYSVDHLLDLLAEAYERKSWHGPNLRGSIRRVSPADAVRAPGTGRKCIAEIVLHAAYWKYTVRRRIFGEPRGSFPLKGSNWFHLPMPFGEDAWRAATKLLDEQHRLLTEAVGGLSPADLSRVTPGGRYPIGFVVRGIALHDVYHAGQIQLLKALLKN